MATATSPYRTPARRAADPPPTEPPTFVDLDYIVVFLWLVTLVRVGGALLRSEPPNRELDVAWLVLFLAPVVLWKELTTRRRRSAESAEAREPEK
jgi:hypothetical protein